MGELESRFEHAAQQAQSLTRRPDNATLLKLYALYKQATSGVVSGKRPGFSDVAGRAKYDAWTKVKGLSKEQAMEQYVQLVEQLKRG